MGKYNIIGWALGILITLIITSSQYFLDKGSEFITFAVILSLVIVMGIAIVTIINKFSEINYLKDSFDKLNRKLEKRDKEIEDKFKIYGRLNKVEVKLDLLNK